MGERDIRLEEAVKVEWKRTLAEIVGSDVTV